METAQQSLNFHFQQDIEFLKHQLEETVKTQLDLFYEQRLVPSQYSVMKYQEKIKELESQNSFMTEEMSKINHYNELLNEKIISLQEELVSYSKVSQVVKIQNKNSELLKKISDLENSIQKLQLENHEIQKINTQLNHKIEEQFIILNKQEHKNISKGYTLCFESIVSSLYSSTYGYSCSFKTSNNPAELCFSGGDKSEDDKGYYHAVLKGLQLFVENVNVSNGGVLHIETSLSLVLDHIKKTKTTNSKPIIAIRNKCTELIKTLTDNKWEIVFNQISKDDNTEAFNECNKIVKGGGSTNSSVSIPVPVTVAVETPKEELVSIPIPVVAETPKEESVSIPVSVVVETPKEESVSIPIPVIVETPKEELVSIPVPVVVETPKEESVVPEVETPKEELINVSVVVPEVETPKEELTNISVPVVDKTPKEESVSVSVPEIVDTPKETEQSKEEPKKVEPEEVKQEITYTLKIMKGKSYYLGSDNFLYSVVEGTNKVGNKVGQKTGEKSYRMFH